MNFDLLNFKINYVIYMIIVVPGRWLDKLGIAARQGIDVIIRQTLYGGHYHMIDNNLEPLPVSNPVKKRIIHLSPRHGGQPN